MNSIRPRVAFAFAFAFVASATAALAQCPLLSQPGPGYVSTDGEVVAATWWDADGTGPAPVRIVFGGDFTIAGSTPCRSLVAMHRTTGQLTTFAPGMVDHVRDLASGPAGELFVAGSRTVGATTTHVVARWQNGAWTQLGSFDAPVLVLSRDGNGDLFAGGEFQQVGTVPAARIARWNGTAWLGLGAGIGGGTQPRVVAIAHAGSDVLAGGRFTQAGAASAANIARWNGSAWSAMGAGIPLSVTSIAVLALGEIVATGPGITEPRVWEANTWQPVQGLTPPTTGTQVVTHVIEDPFSIGFPFPPSRMVAFGRFSAPGAVDCNIAIVDASPTGGASASWSVGVPATATVPHFDAALLPNVGGGGTIALAGTFVANFGAQVEGAAVLEWNAPALSTGIAGELAVVGALPNGDPLVGGAIGGIGDRPILGLARFDGIVWHDFGVGSTVQTLQGPISALEVAPDGSLLAGGTFLTTPALSNGVARFVGSAWTPVGSGLPMTGGAQCLLSRGNDVFAGGAGGLARWNGTSWSMLTGVAAGLGGQFVTLAALPNGDLVAGGNLQIIPGAAAPGVMRWNGTAWSQLGAGLASVVPGSAFSVLSSCVRTNGDLFVVGLSGGNAFCARWNGTSWAAIPAGTTGVLLGILALPDGDLVVGGEFAAIGGVPAASLARWNGTAWSAVGTGVRRGDGAPGRVGSLALSPLGELLLGGDFERVDGELAVKFGRLRPACAAAATPFGAGCVGAGGANGLAATSLPWLGATARSVATGMPANGLALAVHGFGGAFVPLAAVLPAPATCTLWTTPDLVGALVPTTGMATVSLAIPDALSLVGAVLHQQVVALEFGGGGALVGASSTNRLTLTIGAL
jgi:hypothetical protein